MHLKNHYSFQLTDSWAFSLHCLLLYFSRYLFVGFIDSVGPSCLFHWLELMNVPLYILWSSYAWQQRAQYFKLLFPLNLWVYGSTNQQQPKMTFSAGIWWAALIEMKKSLKLLGLCCSILESQSWHYLCVSVERNQLSGKKQGMKEEVDETVRTGTTQHQR